MGLVGENWGDHDSTAIAWYMKDHNILHSSNQSMPTVNYMALEKHMCIMSEMSDRRQCRG